MPAITGTWGLGCEAAKKPTFVDEEVNRAEVEAPFGCPGDPNNLDSDSDGLAYEVVGGARASPSASPSGISLCTITLTTLSRVVEARVQREAIRSPLVTHVTVMTDVRVSRSG